MASGLGRWLTAAVLLAGATGSVGVVDADEGRLSSHHGGRDGENNGCTAVRFAYGGKAGFDRDDVPSSMIPGQSARVGVAR